MNADPGKVLPADTASPFSKNPPQLNPLPHPAPRWPKRRESARHPKAAARKLSEITMPVQVLSLFCSAGQPEMTESVRRSKELLLISCQLPVRLSMNLVDA